MASPIGVILKSINNKGELLDPEFIEKEYVPFVINRSLSYMLDTVLYAHEIDKFPDMPKYDQYLFYYYAVPRASRFARWHKSSKDKYLHVIMEYYNYSERAAKSALSILTESQCEEIAARIDKGGTLNDKQHI